MVSRQETARPLLTPGEVMQLPPGEELVMVSGHPPMRASKLRYFEDRNFTSRVLDPPRLAIGAYGDRPTSRPDDWSALMPATAATTGDVSDRASTQDDGGLQRRPEHVLDIADTTSVETPVDLVLADDDFGAADSKIMTRARRPDPRFARTARLAALDPDDGMSL
jgi:type IV secretion system protein VirD4